MIPRDGKEEGEGRVECVLLLYFTCNLLSSSILAFGKRSLYILFIMRISLSTGATSGLLAPLKTKHVRENYSSDKLKKKTAKNVIVHVCQYHVVSKRNVIYEPQQLTSFDFLKVEQFTGSGNEKRLEENMRGRERLIKCT